MLSSDAVNAGLGTAAARAALVAAWAFAVMHSWIDGSWFTGGPLYLAGHGAALAGFLLLTRRSAGPLPPAHTWLVAASGVFTVVSTLPIVFTAEALGPDPLLTVPGSRLIYLGSYLGALLIARGNVVSGVVASGSITAVVAVSGISAGVPDARLTPLIGVTVMVLIVGSLWRLVLWRIATRVTAHRSVAGLAEQQARAAAEALDATRTELAIIQRIADPELQRIADGKSTIGHEVELRTVEATVRDRIQSPGMIHPSLDDVVRRSRRSGVQVVLLGESSDPLPDAQARAVAGLVAVADLADRVTVRRQRDGEVMVTVAADVVVRRSEVARDGRITAQL